MGPVILVLILFAIASFFVFFKFPPPGAQERQLKAYNGMVVGVCALVCITWYMSVRTDFSGPLDQKNIPLVGIGGSAAFATVYMLVFFAVRNFWMFKGPRR